MQRRIRIGIALGFLALSACAPVEVTPAGAGTQTPTPDDSPNPNSNYHPPGYRDGAVHGLEMNVQAQDCRVCHGETLEGGTSGIGCDGCHVGGWRSNCLFCHGGDDNTSGAPPADVDGTTDPALLQFRSHTAHVMSSVMTPTECVECHGPAPEDVFSPGHVFDDTPGFAEVVFNPDLNPGGEYLGDGTCDTLYCHGDGRTEAGVNDEAGPMTCSSCHPDASSSAADWDTMGGKHAEHLIEGIACNACHESVVDADENLIDPSLHVDGAKELAFEGMAVTMTGDRCTGTCHNDSHNNEPWKGASFHAGGYEDPAIHGLEAKLQQLDCQQCHGQNLAGGDAGVSCNTCHTPGWKEDCTFCHGGTDTAGGAPPRDIDNETNAAQLSFAAHTAHVTATITTPLDCTQCHVKPADALSMGHWFDDTAGVAEVVFTGGLSANGTYNGNGSCSNLYCHGNGRTDNGSVTVADGPMQCDSCHPDINSGSTAWGTMSGEHRKHLRQNITCSDCHKAVVNAGGDAIVDTMLHLNGSKEIELADATITTNNNGLTCDGSCHGDNHNNENW